MKRLDLLRLIGTAARDAGLRWELRRQGSEHEIWDLDGVPVSVPRHQEVNDLTAMGIMKVLEPKLGAEWWRN